MVACVAAEAGNPSLGCRPLVLAGSAVAGSTETGLDADWQRDEELHLWEGPM